MKNWHSSNFLGPNCVDTSRLKYVDNLRPKCVGSSCKQYVKWKYRDILAQKIIIFVNIANLLPNIVEASMREIEILKNMSIGEK